VAGPHTNLLVPVQPVQSAELLVAVLAHQRLLGRLVKLHVGTEQGATVKGFGTTATVVNERRDLCRRWPRDVRGFICIFLGKTDISFVVGRFRTRQDCSRLWASFLMDL